MGKRIIKLFSPSLRKMIPVVASEEQRLDLGSISRAFGLDPATLKLNGHFISRGVDLIASSVTWKSLLSFFSARGLSTGATDSDALIVDGKISKLGSKREHEEDAANGILQIHDGTDRSPWLEHSHICNNKRIKDSSSGTTYGINQVSGCNDSGPKRKLLLADDSHLKRKRLEETDLGLQERKGTLSTSESSRRFLCSFFSLSKKRMREDELVITTPYKKIR